MIRLTASKIDLARRCAFPFRSDAGPRNASTFAATEGQSEHDYIETSLRAWCATRRTGESAADPEAKSPTHRRWRDEWLFAPPGDNAALDWHLEQPIGLNPRTGETRQGPEGWDRRDYSWANWSFMTGTPDAWSLGPAGLRVVDWKTGQAASVKDPRNAGQLLFLGLALSRHLNYRGPVSLEFVLVNDRRLWVEAATVSRADLLAFQAELVRLLDSAETNAQPVEGPWCRSLYCDYFGRCPATAGALATAAATPEAPFKVALSETEIGSPEHASWQFRIVKAASKRLEEAERALKAYARATPIELGDGVLYGEIAKTRETISAEGPGVDEALAMHLGSRASDVVETKRSITKTRIEEVAREVAAERSAATGKRVPITGVVAAVCNDLRAVGAMRVSEYKELAEYRPKVGQGLRAEAAGAAQETA